MTKIAEHIQYLSGVPTGFIADALGKLELWFQATVGILPLRGFEDSKVGGPVVTVKYAPLQNAMAAPRKRNFFEILNDLPQGAVICVQGGSGTAVHGDNQTDMAKRAGAAAIVSEGGSRDISGLREVGLPVWAEGPALRGGKTKWEIVAFNVPIELGSVQVSPGDFIFADECGAVVVPKDLLEKVVQITREVEGVERELEEMRNRGDASPEEVARVYSKKGAKAAA